MPSEHRFVSSGGAAVFWRRFEPASPKATLILVHGMGEHGGRYAEVAGYLSSRGFDVWVPDLRCFGLSGGKRACIRSFSDFHDDLGALVSLAKRGAPDRPLFLMGHSFGGLNVSSFAALRGQDGISGIVLTSPIFGVGFPVPAWKRWLGLAASYVLPDYTEPNRVPTARLTHDAAIMERYAKDPLIYHRISARLFRELTRMMARAGEIAQAIRTPILVLQAEQDSVVSPKAARAFFDRLPGPDKEFVLYEGFYHEILNETRRQEVYSKIALWLESHILKSSK